MIQQEFFYDLISKFIRVSLQTLLTIHTTSTN
ncbi:MAG: hypothetical protein K0Q95_364 [Bacteroidota bacterium]|jgi:hypothetical protein|nr:hypothetical protein [Bacteroidota bacterium]